MHSLDEVRLRLLIASLRPRLPEGYCPHRPTAKQTAFLLLDGLEAFYGGAAGGGKSDGLLMAALAYVDVPGYAAILFRRTYTDLELPGGLIERSKEWLGATDARWIERTHTWAFPAGSSISFGYLQTEQDKYRYKSAEFQFVGFDELTQFSESQYRYLFSRVRRPSSVIGDDPLARVPLRVRGASNPGDRGHAWVKARFLPRYLAPDGRYVTSTEAVAIRLAGKPIAVEYPEDEDGQRRIFIPARIEDNPHLDQESYRANLRRLDPIEAARLEAGDWDVAEGGKMFPREKARVLERIPPGVKRWCRAWDFAATEEREAEDPDFTAGAKVGVDGQGRIIVADMIRGRYDSYATEKLVVSTARSDGRRECQVRFEQEPGSSGKAVVNRYVRQLLVGFDAKGRPSSGSKVVRALNFSAQWQAENVYIVRGAWNAAYLDEMNAFPPASGEIHDDQADASVLGFEEIVGYRRRLRALGATED